MFSYPPATPLSPSGQLAEGPPSLCILFATPRGSPHYSPPTSCTSLPRTTPSLDLPVRARPSQLANSWPAPVRLPLWLHAPWPTSPSPSVRAADRRPSLSLHTLALGCLQHPPYSMSGIADMPRRAWCPLHAACCLCYDTCHMSLPPALQPQES